MYSCAQIFALVFELTLAPKSTPMPGKKLAGFIPNPQGRKWWMRALRTCGVSKVGNLLVHQMVNLAKCCCSAGGNTRLMLRSHSVLHGRRDSSGNGASERLEI